MIVIKKKELPSEVKYNGKVYIPSQQFMFKNSGLLIVSSEQAEKLIVISLPNKKQYIFEESQLSVRHEDALRLEIQHIFESGANKIRVFEMVRRFINQISKPK